MHESAARLYKNLFYLFFPEFFATFSNRPYPKVGIVLTSLCIIKTI